MHPCRPRQRKFRKSDYEVVHSEVYLNKCAQHFAVLYTCLSWLLSKCHINVENCSFFACFRFLIFDPFSRGVSLPYLPLCADAHESVCYEECIYRRVVVSLSYS